MRASRAHGKDQWVWFVPAIVIVFVVGLAAEAKSPDRLAELIKLTGLEMAFDRVGAQLKAGMTQALPNSPLSAAYQEKVLAGLDPAIEVAFAPEMLKREFRLAIDGKLKKADLDSILTFYKSPLGTHMITLEKANITADAQAQRTKMAAELLERLKNDPDRAKVLTLMDSSLRLTEISTDIAFNMGRAVAIGMVAADEKTTVLRPDSIEVIDSALQKMRPAMTTKMKEQILLSLAHTYREASIPELRQYLAFLTSPTAKRYYSALMPAMNEVLVKAGGEFGHALMRELGKEHI